MKLNRILYLLPLVFLTFCQKDPSLDGNSPGGLLSTVDSTFFTAYTVADEPGDALNESDVPLGKMDDPRFGSVVSSFYSQLRLTTISFEPGANAAIDSAFIEIDIESAYGPLTNAMDIEVYALIEDISVDNDYKTDLDLNVGGTLLGGLTYTYNSEDEILQIPLTTAFAEDMLALFGTSVTEGNDAFIDFFKGIYVTIDPNSGGDGHLDLSLTSSNSAMKLYFSSDTPSDSLYSFLMDEQSVRLNKYELDFSGSELETVFNDNSTDDNELLLSGFNASYIRIDLPDLSFLSGNVINQAKLTFYQSDYDNVLNDDYGIPDFLFLSGGIEDDSLQYLLPDYSSSNPVFYGGTSELVEVNGNTTNAYSYYLPRFTQQVVNGDTNIEFLTLEVLNFNNGNRIKLGGGSHPDFPIRLEILYTKP